MIIMKNRNLYDVVINLKSRLRTALQVDAEIYIPVTITQNHLCKDKDDRTSENESRRFISCRFLGLFPHFH